MGTLQSGIELYDGFSAPLYSMINALNLTVSAFEDMQRISGNQIDTSSIDGARAAADEATMAFQTMQDELSWIGATGGTVVAPTIPSVEAPVAWKSDAPQINIPQDMTVPVTPVVTEQPQINVPQDMTVPVTPVVTEQPQINIPQDMTVYNGPQKRDHDNAKDREYSKMEKIEKGDQYHGTDTVQCAIQDKISIGSYRGRKGVGGDSL